MCNAPFRQGKDDHAPNCDYWGGPAVETKFHYCGRCNAVYSKAPHPRDGKPCEKKEGVYFDGINLLCCVDKPPHLKGVYL